MVEPTANDEALALALQQEELGSDEEEADPELARALALSRLEKEQTVIDEDIVGATDDVGDEEPLGVSDEEPPMPTRQTGDSDDSGDDLEEVSLVPSGRTTPQNLSVPEITPAQSPEGSQDELDVVAVSPPRSTLPAQPQDVEAAQAEEALQHVDEALEEIQDLDTPAAPVEHTTPPHVPDPTRQVESRNGLSSNASAVPAQPANKVSAVNVDAGTAKPRTVPHPPTNAVGGPSRPVRPPPMVQQPPSTDRSLMTLTRPQAQATLSREDRYKSPDLDHDDPLPEDLRMSHRRTVDPLLAYTRRDDDDESLSDLQPARSRSASSENLERMEHDDEEEAETDRGEEEEQDETGSIRWSKSPSPRPKSRPQLQTGESGESIPIDEEDGDDIDMTAGDMVAEEDDYARFLASIKNRDLNEVRTEIDDEIRVLNAANKVAMRDSDEISQAMIAQIQVSLPIALALSSPLQTLLRHFGIPYITAPMEAEAQCAKLAELNLVDGIITDDSDVFLFGGKQCFKNIFNDAKYAECFLLTDIDRELSLTRERLISLAYLLGSDYTIGLPGVGPVIALELLANFPGEEGVDNFKSWWMKVQRGQDSEWETNTKWKKSFVSCPLHSPAGS